MLRSRFAGVEMDFGREPPARADVDAGRYAVEPTRPRRPPPPGPPGAQEAEEAEEETRPAADDADRSGRITLSAIGRDGYVVGATAVAGGVLLLPRLALRWAPRRFRDVSADALLPVALLHPPIDVLLVGTGDRTRRIDAAVLAQLEARGVAVEFMDSRSAAGAFSLLQADRRSVAAALLPISAGD